MDMGLYIELFGYLGSFLVVVSMLMSSVIKLRIINIIGSTISGTYALIIGSFPLALMNICLIIINAYNILKLKKESRKYEIVKGDSQENFFKYFVDRYGDDIKKHFGDFNAKKISGNTVYYVFCNEAPVGLFVGNNKNKNVEIVLDYTVPDYRDCSVAKFLYIAMKKNGIDRLEMKNPSIKHIEFLEKMGYSREENSYVKVLMAD